MSRTLPSSSGDDERERRPGQLGARRPPDAVNVVLGLPRHVEIDDMAERGHVDAARGDVGGDQHLIAAALESGERLGALRLRSIAVNALHLHPMLVEMPRQTIGAMLGPREHQRVAHLAALEQRQQQRRLQMLRHRIDGLRDADGRQRPPLDVDRRRRRAASPCDSSAIGGGIVALKNSVCRRFGR